MMNGAKTIGKVLAGAILGAGLTWTGIHFTGQPALQDIHSTVSGLVQDKGTLNSTVDDLKGAITQLRDKAANDKTATDAEKATFLSITTEMQCQTVSFLATGGAVVPVGCSK